MKFKNPLLIVTNMDKTVEFYKKVLGLHVVMIFPCQQNLNWWLGSTDPGNMGKLHREK